MGPLKALKDDNVCSLERGRNDVDREAGGLHQQAFAVCLGCFFYWVFIYMDSGEIA